MAQRPVSLEALAAREALHARVVAMGGRVMQAYGARVWIVDVPEGAEEAPGAGWPGVVGAYEGPAPAEMEVDDDAGRLGIAAWNVRHSASFAATRANRV